MSTILQIIISVALIYFAFSLLVYIVVEWISGLLQFRGKQLRNAIFNAFNDFGSLLYSHPQVAYLKRSRDKLPAYIPARNIALGLIDLIRKQADSSPNPGQSNPGSISDKNEMAEPFSAFKVGLRSLKEGPFKTLMESLIAEATDFAGLRKNLEKWYNDYMDRVTGWYKKKISSVVLLVSFIVTVTFNLDSLYMVKAVTRDPVLRGNLNILAGEVLQDSLMNQIILDAKASADLQRTRLQLYLDSLRKNQVDTSVAKLILVGVQQDSLVASYIREKQRQLMELNQRINSWDLPIGWNLKKSYAIFPTLVGWALTLMALSAGAPFWFDLLKKMINVRSSGIKPK